MPFVNMNIQFPSLETKSLEEYAQRRCKAIDRKADYIVEDIGIKERVNLFVKATFLLLASLFFEYKQVYFEAFKQVFTGRRFQHPQIVQNMLKSYANLTAGWMALGPKDLVEPNHQFKLLWGGVAYTGVGRWKIHISIDPKQMEQAIPIIVSVLHDSHAPRMGLKMATKALLNSTHQIGKEIALIFDQDVEAAAVRGDLASIETCLSTLWKRLYEAGIRPEPGHVLTPQTMDLIATAAEGTQICEKENLQAGKFDRAVVCPRNCNFFYYREELFLAMRDDSMEGFRSVPGVFSASQVLQIARQNPDIAHNPMQMPDPFINLQIREAV
jgi:hypothetical protein